jgi:hypothetical protein
MSKTIYSRTEDLVCEKYLNGISAKEITEIADCCLDTVYKIIKRRGLQTNNSRIESMIDQRYLDGLNAVEIAEELGCCPETVYNLLKKHNIPRRPRELSLRKYNLDVNFFSKIDTEEKAYWLGFVTADGAIVNSRLNVKLSSKDRIHLEKLSNSLSTDQPICDILSERKGKLHPSSYLCISSKIIIEDLKKYGVVPRKSLREVFYNCSDELQRHYLRGLFDGDGSIGKVKYGWKLSMCGSKDLIHEFRDHLVNSLEVTPQKLRNQKNLWYLYVGRKTDVRTVLNYLYQDSTVSLDRKFSLYKQVMS